MTLNAWFLWHAKINTGIGLDAMLTSGQSANIFSGPCRDRSLELTTVVAACPIMCAIDCSSCARRQLSGVLANQNAVFHVRPSGHLSGRHVWPAKCDFYTKSTILVSFTENIFPSHLSVFGYRSVLIWGDGSRYGWGCA